MGKKSITSLQPKTVKKFSFRNRKTIHLEELLQIPRIKTSCFVETADLGIYC